MDEILALEHAGWLSLCRGSGSTFYGELMIEDAQMILANGAVLGRDQVVASLRDAPPWDSYAIDDPKLLDIADDVAVLVYRGSGTRGEQRFVGLMSSVYVRRGEAWRLALYQQTPAS